MYYAKNNIYINEDNRVLFDLNKLNIYELDDNTLNIFKKLYYNKDYVANTAEEREVYDELFENCNQYEDNDDVTSIRLNVSNVCNLKCSYCYANYGNYGNLNSKMSSDLSKKACKYIEDNYHHVREISFFGGEPLLNPEAIEVICKYFENKDIKFSIVTNLTVLDDEIINLINKYKISITGSIDGPKDINDMNRVTADGKGTYEKISDNIKELNLRASTSLKMIETTYTKKSFERYSKKDIAEYFYNNFNINNILFADVITDDKDLKLPDEYYKDTESLTENINYFFENLINKRISYLDKVAGPILLFFNKKYHENFCYAGIKSVLIDDVGNVWPCQGYINKKEYLMGNILEEGASNLNIQNFDRVKNKLKCIQKSKLSHCNECIAKYWCNPCIPHTDLIDSNKPHYFNEKKCGCNREITEKMLDGLAAYVKKDMIGTISKNFKELVEIS